MTINRELDRHITEALIRGDKKAEEVFKAQKQVFNALKEAGILFELPVEGETKECLIDILSAVKIKPGRGPLLTVELAQKINRRMGQDLKDEVLLQALILQNGKIQGGERRINPQLLGMFNRTLKGLMCEGYSTIGLIRDADLSNFRRTNIGVTTVAFVKTAFARPQPPEGQA